jgi:uncharacterized protein
VLRTSQQREWPGSTLNFADLVTAGWRPTPFREFIVKTHSRCNLACDYCYVYEAADQSWKSVPPRISAETVRRTAARVAEHALKHQLDSVEIVFHGGEPLLAGIDLIDFAAREFRAAVPAFCRVELSLQTNGVLLTKSVLERLATHKIGVSVSLDGDQSGHDLHRLYANGRGSHAAVMRGLTLLAGPYRSLYRGLVCTVELANDPLSTYEALLATDPPRLHFLLPHGTWSAPPPGRPPADDGTTAYADWLATIFDKWFHTRPQRTRIRIFEEIMRTMLGLPSRSESTGLSPVAMIVIETDGSMQQVDSLKASYPGAPDTGLTVHDHDFDEALRHPGVVARQIGLAALSQTCQACPVRDYCGGGAYMHRHRAGHGFQNPSVYCPDLRKLIGHIGRQVRSELDQRPGVLPSERGRLEVALQELAGASRHDLGMVAAELE